jgi:hypothetical protein
MRQKALVLVIGLALVGGTALAQGTITDGDANFVRGSSPWDTSPGADFNGVSSTLTQDHVFETGWWFRVAGDTQESVFGTPDSQGYVTNTSTIGWLNVGARGLFSAGEVSVVNDADGLGGPTPSGYVTMTMTLTNLSPTDPLVIDVFHMVDIDLAGSGSDSALAVGVNHINLTDPSLNTAQYHGLGASAYLIRPFGATDLGAVLSDAAVTNFDSSGSPFGPGDFTGGFQWPAVSIPPLGVQTFQAIIAVNAAATPVELVRLEVE